MQRSSQDRARRRSIRGGAFRLVVVTIAMFAFGVFVLPPLYDILCEVTGLNGKTGRVTAAQTGTVHADRWVTVEFIANVNRQLPWDFAPHAAKMRVNPGRVYETTFWAHNRAARPLTGQAVPSVTPARASIYFNKTECFCFTRQLFAAGEGRDMPVRFVVDANLPKEIDTVTLSYTFFEVDTRS